MKKQNMIFSIIWMVLGLGLVICGAAAVIDDFWSGFGGGLFVIGVLQMIRYLRYRTNPEYRESFDINVTDERNQFIRRKAWAAAAYVFVILAALAIIILSIVGKDSLLMGISASVGALVLLFWIFYFYFKSKD